MAVETLTIDLGGSAKVKGKNLVAGDEDDTQIVEVRDGGSLSGTYMFEFWGKDSPTEPGDGPGGNDIFRFDLSAFDDDFSIEVKSFDELDQFIFTDVDSYSVTDGVYTLNYTGSDGQPHTITIDPVSANGTGTATVVVLCFARGSLIGTPGGAVPVEQLVEGDKVRCGDGCDRAISWIGKRALSVADLAAHPQLRPVRIARDALGSGVPERDLLLSPQHKIMLRDWRAELLFGQEAVLVPAKFLVDDRAVRTMAGTEPVEYYHILLEGHHTVIANGLECETLMPAEMAQTGLSGAARAEILALFPEMITDLGAFGSACGRVLRAHEAEVLMAV